MEEASSFIITLTIKWTILYMAILWWLGEKGIEERNNSSSLCLGRLLPSFSPFFQNDEHFDQYWWCLLYISCVFWKCRQWLEVVVCRPFSVVLLTVRSMDHKWSNAASKEFPWGGGEVLLLRPWEDNSLTEQTLVPLLFLPGSILDLSLAEGGGLSLTVLHSLLQRSE